MAEADTDGKGLAKKSAWQRLRLLTASFTGLTALIALFLGAYVAGSIQGYNEITRVIFYASEAKELQRSLDDAVKDIKAAVKEIGPANIPLETQRRLVRAIAYVENVSGHFTPSKDNDPGMIVPKIFGSIISPAYADEQAPQSKSIITDAFRQYLAGSIFGVISVFWLGCIIIYLASKDEKKIAFSGTMIQTVLGFYIGIFTGLLGLTPPS